MEHVRLLGSFLTLLACLVLGLGFSGNGGNRSPTYVSCSLGQSSEGKSPHDQATDRQLQTASSQQQDKLETAPASPYELLRYIVVHKNDERIGGMRLSLQNYWLRLGIPTEDWRGYGNCRVDLFKIAITSSAREDVLLRLYDDSGWSWGCRYLLFTKPDGQGTEWNFLGYVDLIDQRDGVPEHEVIDAGTRRWLAITMLGARGSGYRLYVESLYEIANNGLEEVMNFPSHGYLGGVADHACPTKEFNGRITSVRSGREATVVNVELNITYSEEDEKNNCGVRNSAQYTGGLLAPLNLL